MHLSASRLLTVLLGYLVAQAKSYPMQTWPMYPQSAREYNDDEYYYAPKVQYYFDAPAISLSEADGHLPYPYYYVIPKEQEERMAALPIGQETWFESDTTPDWRANDVDDVNAAFLDNLILTQMAQDAKRRRENARAIFAPVDYEETGLEDEEVRELKALAGRPLHHEPKTVPRFEDDDYPADEGFINWNGNKRSVPTVSPLTTTSTTTAEAPARGQDEVVVPRPAQTHHHNKKDKNDYLQTITQLLATKSAKTNSQDSSDERRIAKRFIAGDRDLVLQLRGLKHRVPT